ncbi:MAG: hypothetical protein ACK55Z_34605, partial [bacterium]
VQRGQLRRADDAPGVGHALWGVHPRPPAGHDPRLPHRRLRAGSRGRHGRHAGGRRIAGRAARPGRLHVPGSVPHARETRHLHRPAEGGRPAVRNRARSPPDWRGTDGAVLR